MAVMKNLVRTICIFLALSSLFLTLSSCTPAPPRNLDNICSIFREYPRWYWASLDTQKRWRIPVSVQMAIIHQESHFRGNAKPPRTKLFWVIPWFRPTSAYGYSQAVDGTWKRYQHDTGSAGSRNTFADATNFIGWYSEQARKRLSISKRNSYALYLAYHEGMGGYERGTYRQKRWLIAVARKVARRARLYHSQLMACRHSLPKKSWWQVW
jgi:hypothetical protein